MKRFTLFALLLLATACGDTEDSEETNTSDGFVDNNTANNAPNNTANNAPNNTANNAPNNTANNAPNNTANNAPNNTPPEDNFSCDLFCGSTIEPQSIGSCAPTEEACEQKLDEVCGDGDEFRQHIFNPSCECGTCPSATLDPLLAPVPSLCTVTFNNATQFPVEASGQDGFETTVTLQADAGQSFTGFWFEDFDKVFFEYPLEGGVVELEQSYSGGDEITVNCPEEARSVLYVFDDVTLYTNEALTQEACTLSEGQVYRASISSKSAFFLDGVVEYAIGGLEQLCNQNNLYTELLRFTDENGNRIEVSPISNVEAFIE